MSSSSTPRNFKTNQPSKQKQTINRNGSYADVSKKKEEKKVSFSKDSKSNLKTYTGNLSKNISKNKEVSLKRMSSENNSQGNSLSDISLLKDSKQGKLSQTNSRGSPDSRNQKKNSNTNIMSDCCAKRYSKLYGENKSLDGNMSGLLQRSYSSCDALPGKSVSSGCNGLDNDSILKFQRQDPQKYSTSTMSLCINSPRNYEDKSNNDTTTKSNQNQESEKQFGRRNVGNYVLDNCVNIQFDYNDDNIDRDNYCYTEYYQESYEANKLLVDITEVNETEENDLRDQISAREEKLLDWHKEREGVNAQEYLTTLIKKNIIDIPDRKIQSSDCLIKVEAIDSHHKTILNFHSFTIQDAEKFDLPSDGKIKNKLNNRLFFKQRKVLSSYKPIDMKVLSLSPKHVLEIDYDNEKITFLILSDLFKKVKRRTAKRKTITVTSTTYNNSKNSLLSVMEQSLISNYRLNDYKLEKMDVEIDAEKQRDEINIRKEDLEEFLCFNEKLKSIFNYDMNINERIKLFQQCKKDKNLLHLLESVENKKEEEMKVYKKNSYVKGYRNSKSIKEKDNSIRNENDLNENKSSHPYVKQRIHYSLNKVKSKQTTKEIETLRSNNNPETPNSNNNTNQLIKQTSITNMSPSHLQTSLHYLYKVFFKESFTERGSERNIDRSPGKGDIIYEKKDSYVSFGDKGNNTKGKTLQSSNTNQIDICLTKVNSYQSTIDPELDKFSKEFTLSSLSSSRNRQPTIDQSATIDQCKSKYEGIEKNINILKTSTKSGFFNNNEIREKYKLIESNRHDSESTFFRRDRNEKDNKSSLKSFIYPANDSRYGKVHIKSSPSKYFK